MPEYENGSQSDLEAYNERRREEAAWHDEQDLVDASRAEQEQAKKGPWTGQWLIARKRDTEPWEVLWFDRYDHAAMTFDSMQQNWSTVFFCRVAHSEGHPLNVSPLINEMGRRCEQAEAEVSRLATALDERTVERDDVIEEALKLSDERDKAEAEAECVALRRSQEWQAERHEATAEAIARKCHEGQVDKQGQPYMRHVERVAQRVEASVEARTVAWLHDVIEDCPEMSRGRLALAGIPEPILQAVDLLTRVPPFEYAPYIQQIKASGNPLALAVKVADLRDHLDRNDCPESLKPRYVAALIELTGDK